MLSSFKSVAAATLFAAAVASGAAAITSPAASPAAAPVATKAGNSNAAPDFTGIDNWLNSDPLTMQQLRGKVVLVDFWTYTCINCIDVLPHVKAWNQEFRNQGLVVVGVHTPEYPFERSTDNVKGAVRRLGITFPEITEMQAQAILEAAVQVKSKGGDPHVEIMIPLIGSIEEMRNQATIVRHIAELVFKEKGATVDYMVGTMIELPRAALTADEVAEEAEFFSFGTNDLTQTTMGLSRDDYTHFQKDYENRKIFANDPFAILDQEIGRAHV